MLQGTTVMARTCLNTTKMGKKVVTKQFCEIIIAISTSFHVTVSIVEYFIYIILRKNKCNVIDHSDPFCQYPTRFKILPKTNP